MENQINIEFFKNEYDALVRETEPLMKSLEDDQFWRGDPSLLGLTFEDFLNLAGLSKVIGKGSSTIKKWLAFSAKILLINYGLSIELKGGGHATLYSDNYSLNNGYHFIVGLYAAFASGNPDLALELAECYKNIEKTSQVVVHRKILEYAENLASDLCEESEPKERKRTLINSEEERLQGIYWEEQFKLFSTIQKAISRDNFFVAAMKLDNYLNEEYQENLINENWIRVLKLPVLGLTELYNYRRKIKK